MSTLAALDPDSVFRSVALALIHFLWQGALVALLLAGANRVLRRSSARARYAAACAALLLMAALPAATFLRLRPRGSASARPALATASAAGMPAAAASARPPRDARGRPDALATASPWIVAGWLAGVCLLSLRFLAGTVATRRLAHRGTQQADPAWQDRLSFLARRLGIRRMIRLLESAVVEVPTVVGLVRPIVLLPVGLATGLSASQIESLLVHELAHIRRSDSLVNLLQALAETLLFYHPAVWWVSECIRAERENACDDLAVAATGDAVAYARALLELAERRETLPVTAFAADGGQLWSRISRLVPPATRGESGAFPRWVAGVLVLGGVLALGAASEVPSGESASGHPGPVVTVAASQPGESAPATPTEEAKPPAPAPTQAKSSPQARSRTEAALQTQEPARGLLSPDDLVAFRIHGVTPEFIGEIIALGYTRATPDQLVALRIHDVTPEYVRAMKAIFGTLTLDDVVAFRIHGVNAEDQLQLEALLGKLSADDAVAMRIHGADPDYVKGFRDAGFSSPSPDEVVALRIHGATPEFARAMKAQGFSQLSLDDLVAFRIHGITPEYVAAIRGLGYASLSADEVTAFRIHGVTPESIRTMNQRAGERLSPDELVDWQIHSRSRARPSTDKEAEP
jgi:beta-lactamase regulating signal transducer with metallopeptidase domain